MSKATVVIIGAGMAGASLAYRLAATNQIILLEREQQAGYHTTGRSAATLAKAYGNDTIRALTLHSETFFLRPPPGFTNVDLLSDLGQVLIARQDQAHLIEREFERTRRFVSSVEILDRQALIKKIPLLRPDYAVGGVFEASSTGMDVDAIHQGFLRGARRQGADIRLDQEILDLSPIGHGWTVTTPNQKLHADIVVNAAGAWADDIAKMAGIHPFGLTPCRRTAFTIAPPKDINFDHCPLIIDIEEQFYLKPDAGMLLCSPADETPSPPCDAQPEDLDIAIAADRIQKALDLEITRISSKWAGLRTFTADRTPVLGFDPKADGFFWLAGQGGYGIQTAPAMAEAAAALITDREPPVPLINAVKAMSPARGKTI